MEREVRFKCSGVQRDHLEKAMEFIKFESKKNFELNERKVVFWTFKGSLAEQNILKLFQEEVLRQINELKLRE